MAGVPSPYYMQDMGESPIMHMLRQAFTPDSVTGPALSAAQKDPSRFGDALAGAGVPMPPGFGVTQPIDVGSALNPDVPVVNPVQTVPIPPPGSDPALSEPASTTIPTNAAGEAAPTTGWQPKSEAQMAAEKYGPKAAQAVGGLTKALTPPQAPNVSHDSIHYARPQEANANFAPPPSGLGSRVNLPSAPNTPAAPHHPSFSQTGVENAYQQLMKFSSPSPAKDVLLSKILGGK